MGPTVVKGMNELMRDDSVHVGLLVNVVLTQDDLEAQANVDYRKGFRSHKKLLISCQELVSYLRRSGIEAAAHCPVTVFTDEMSVI